MAIHPSFEGLRNLALHVDLKNASQVLLDSEDNRHPQDGRLELLKDCVKVGKQEGQPMSALRELIDRVQTRHLAGAASLTTAVALHPN